MQTNCVLWLCRSYLFNLEKRNAKFWVSDSGALKLVLRNVTNDTADVFVHLCGIGFVSRSKIQGMKDTAIARIVW